MGTRRNHSRGRFPKKRGSGQLYRPRHHEREPSQFERENRYNSALKERAYNGEGRDRSFRRSPRSMSPIWDNDRMVNRGRRSVSPSCDGVRIVRLKSNFLDKNELSGRNDRTSPNRLYESQEEDRYSESSQNGNFTQNHSSYHSYRDKSSRHERCDKRYTPERSYRNNVDIIYERDKHKKVQSAHDKYRQQDSDTFWNGHVGKHQSYDRRRRNNYYDDSDDSDDVNSSEGQMYIGRRHKTFDKPSYGGRTIDNGEDTSGHRNIRLRQAHSESASSDWHTDETRQLEDGEIRSPSRDRTGNASLKQERLDLSPVSHESINNTFDQYYDSDADRPCTAMSAEASMEDENEYLVKQQPDAFAKKYTLTLDTLELLKTLTDELKQEIAGDIMSILLCAGTDLPIEILCDELKEKKIYFELITLENFLEGKFKITETKVPLSSHIPTGTKLVVPLTNIRVCVKHSNDGTQSKCNCNDLHICKFFLLSTCPNRDSCKFGHKLKTDHNIRVLKLHFLHRLTLQQIKNFIRQIENRNRTTTPKICKFYNTERGCKYEKGFDNWTMCQCLDVCRFCISNSCKFGAKCKRSHDLFSGQPREVLSLYGLMPKTVDQYTKNNIVAMLNRVTNSSDEVITTRPKDLQMQTDLLVKDAKRMDGKLAMHLPNEENFIPLEVPDQDRYFSQRSSDSTSYSKGCDSSFDISGDSTTVSFEEEADSESKADVCKKFPSLELAKTNDLKSRKRNFTVDTDKSPDQAKIPKLTDVDEKSDTTVASLSLQTKELPRGLEYIGLDNIKKEISSEPVANIDVDTIKSEPSVQKKELQEVGPVIKASVDTVKTEILPQTYELPSPMENVDADTTETNISSQTNKPHRVMENGGADTISMKISFPTKEVSKAFRNGHIDTSTTEIPLQTRKSPDRCMATDCDNKSDYNSVAALTQPDLFTLDTELNVSTKNDGSVEQLQATSDISADQKANGIELHCQNSWSLPSDFKHNERTDSKEETESVGQEQNPGEGDANRKGVADSLGWRLTGECEKLGLMQELPFTTLEDKYQQFINSACCEIKFQDKRLIFNFKTMDGKVLTNENEEIEIQLGREASC